MRIRFSPFKRRQDGIAGDITRPPLEPIPSNQVPKSISKPKYRRSTTIVHPDQGAAYRLKSRLLSDGHRQVETFFMPESLLAVIKQGHTPDVIMIHDFLVEEAGMTGAELAHTLRTEHRFTGLLFTTSENHAGMPVAALEVYGFSGHVNAYLSE